MRFWAKILAKARILTSSSNYYHSSFALEKNVILVCDIGCYFPNQAVYWFDFESEKRGKIRRKLILSSVNGLCKCESSFDGIRCNSKEKYPSKDDESLYMGWLKEFNSMVEIFYFKAFHIN